MKKLFAAFVLCAAAATLGVTDAKAAAVYRSGEGWSTESEDEGPAAKDANEQLKRAEEYEKSGDKSHAATAYRTLARRFPDSIHAAKAQFKLAQMLEDAGDYENAFKAYGDYLKKFPRGDGFNQAVEGQYRIASLFLQGERRKLFGVKTLPSMVRTQEMFEEIVKNAPYSKFAPLSQFNIGQALEKQGKPTEALAAYQKVLVSYPEDPVAADAQYQIGYVWFSQTREGSYDRLARERARDAFEDFIARYPQSEKVPQAKDNIKALSGAKTGNLLEVARFYDKQKQYKAAVIYYNEIIKTQPDSPESKAAKQRIDELVSLVGEDALRAGPEKAETGERARQRRRMQAQVDTASRPDYVGPAVVVPDEVAPRKPKLRTSPEDVAPVPAVEPELPSR